MPLDEEVQRHLASCARRNTARLERVSRWDVEEGNGRWKSRPGTGSCSSPGWAQSQRAGRSASPGRPGYRWRAEVGGEVPLRLAEAVRSNRYLSLLERQRTAALYGQGVSVREIARRLDRARPRSAASCAGTPQPMSGASTTYPWRTPGRGRGELGRAAPVWSLTWICEPWCRPSWRSSGVLSRSQRTCGWLSRTGRAGTCVTRRSTRRCTAGSVVD
jgi:hypothetical protein